MRKFDAVRAWLDGQAKSKVYGAAAAVSVNGERVFTGYAGFSDADGRYPVGEHTLSLIHISEPTRP